MQQHTYAFAKEGGRAFINLSHSEKLQETSHEETDDEDTAEGIGRIWQSVTNTVKRIRALDSEVDTAADESKNLAMPEFRPIDLDSTSQRDEVIKHFIELVQQFPEISEVVYIAVRNFFNAGIIGYYLAHELSETKLNIKGEINAYPLEMDELPGIDLNDVYAVSITVIRPNV